MKNVDSGLKAKVIEHTAEYEHRMRVGSKAIFHLEAFCAKLMSVYAQFLNELSF
jgi:replication factor C subunit 3/5